MDRASVTREQFARWSFIRDKHEELYPRHLKWADLPQDEKDGYLEEADYYMKDPNGDWPKDILERLKDMQPESVNG